MSTQPLFPHQETGARFLAERGFAILADDMGLGKTRTAVHGADISGCRKILVFCPKVVKPHWAREFTQHQQIDRPVTIVDGSPKTPPGPGVTIMTTAALADDTSVDMIRHGFPYDLIIADEYHTFRAYNAARTRNLLTPLSGVHTWAWRMWGLTGTPIVNSAADLWPTFSGPMKRVVDWYEFAKFYTNVKMTDDGPKPIGIRNTAILADMLRPYVLRRTMESLNIDLPPLTQLEAKVPVDPKVMTEINAKLRNWSPARLQQALADDSELKDEALASVRRVLGLAKVPAVAQHVYDRIKSGEGPIVVFFQHTAVREKLYEILGPAGCNFQVSWIDGKITPTQLTLAESWFQAGKIDVLLVQTQAGGQGLTLHRANQEVFAELGWTAVSMQQAEKRIHRIGQTRPCEVTVLRADHWMETLLSSVIGYKERASAELLSLLTTGD